MNQLTNKLLICTALLCLGLPVAQAADDDAAPAPTRPLNLSTPRDGAGNALGPRGAGRWSGSAADGAPGAGANGPRRYGAGFDARRGMGGGMGGGMGPRNPRRGFGQGDGCPWR
jgi:hypothetical protein